MAKKRAAKKPYQVFVSHACEKIEFTGAKTFRDDRDIHGGGDIPEEIRRQIKLSKEMVVLLTPDSVGRQWVTFEVGAAWGWSKRTKIVFIMCHVSTDPIPDMIKNKKAFSLNDFDQYLNELANRLRSYDD